MIRTARLILRHWHEDHCAAFAALHADAEVTADLGGPFDAAYSYAKFERYRRAWAEHGISRWAIEDREGVFQGYAGVMFRPDPAHPLGPHHEIGWRLKRAAWGKGYATEAARAALDDATLDRVYCYTSATNQRSQGVIRKLGLVRDASLDFAFVYNGVDTWEGLVWRVARP